MKTLEAFIDRLIPTDELGPGAVEARAQVYIDRVLAGEALLVSLKSGAPTRGG
jgi:hypothetical protein